MRSIGDYIKGVPLHQKEGRPWSPVEHEDLARWAITMDELLAACKPFVEPENVSPIWHEGDAEVRSCAPVDITRGERYEVFVNQAEMVVLMTVVAKIEGS